MLDKYVCRSPNIIWRIIDGKAFLMNEDGDQIHSLNKVGSFIWELANGSRTINEIIARISQRFQVEAGVARQDCLEFVGELVKKGVSYLKDNPARREQGAKK